MNKIRYKVGPLDQPIYVIPGDALRLSVQNFLGIEFLHTEAFHSSRELTHWAFMEITGVSDVVFVGNESLIAWLEETFPDAERIPIEEELFV